MKKILSFAVLFAGLSVATFAQDKAPVKKGKFERIKKERVQKTPEEIAKIRTERLDTELKFTDKQRQEVYSYNLEQAKKHKEKAQVRQKQRAQERAEMKADLEKFKSLLSAEQQKIMADKLAKSQEKRFNKRDGQKRKFRDGERRHRKSIEKDTKEIESSNS